MFFSRKKSTDKEPEAPKTAPEKPQGGLFGRLKTALHRTRGTLVEGITSLFAGAVKLDDDLVEEIELLLLSADLGVPATEHIISNLKQRISRKEVADGEAVFRALRQDMLEILATVAKPLETRHVTTKPFVILMVGVNGTGKTTSIGKLAKSFTEQGQSVMLAAGDTFRAAAIEQLQTWGERNQVPVIAQHTGADSASVIYDALAAAGARGFDMLIADTAGRLHTQVGLMDELKKVRRVMGKIESTAPHETLLVIDAGTGQNALSQARQFQEAVEVTGLIVTKLDGTAKGGIVFAIAKELGLPIRFIGVGEGIDDLRPFDAEAFVDALLERS